MSGGKGGSIAAENSRKYEGNSYERKQKKRVGQPWDTKGNLTLHEVKLQYNTKAYEEAR